MGNTRAFEHGTWNYLDEGFPEWQPAICDQEYEATSTSQESISFDTEEALNKDGLVRGLQPKEQLEYPNLN
jgi:hypothetical protein